MTALAGDATSQWPEAARSRKSELGVAPRRRRLIGIVERLPAYRRGLAAELSAREYDVCELTELAAVDGADALVCSGDLDRNVSVFAELKALQPDVILILLLDDSNARTWRQALRAGADAVVPRDASLEAIVDAVDAALNGITTLPTALVREIVELDLEPDNALAMSEDEVVWLRELAGGTTVAGLARSATYSERQMHRLIADIYRRIGARNRQEALVLAARRGILD